MSNWYETTFSEFVDINPKVKLEKGVEYSFVEMADLDSTNKFCEPKRRRVLTGGMRFENGDTLFARITPCLENGKICQVRNLDGGQGFGSTEFHVLRGKKSVSDSNFIFYLSRWSEVRDFAELNLHGTSGRQRMPHEAFQQLRILVPPLQVQYEIAEILSSLDDKIDLLHRQNKTLEEMAEGLWRQWFVEEAEENWKVETIENVISVKGGTTPNTSNPAYWDGDICWTSPRDLSNATSVFLFDTERKITALGLSKIGSGLLPVGTLLMSSRAPIGYLTITEVPVAINQGYIAIICDKLLSNYFMFLWCKANMDIIEGAGNGSVFQEISKASFKSLSITVPSEKLLNEFDEKVTPIFQKLKVNSIQIHSLMKLRDSLLPKLMSGEIRIN